MTTTKLPRYAVLMHDGFPSNPWPEPPSADNTVATIAEARRLFRSWLRDSGNDYTRAEGYGAPYADVVRTDMWDGVSYGDTTGGDGVCRFGRGPRGGIVRENF